MLRVHVEVLMHLYVTAGTIPLADITAVKLRPEKQKGCRLDIAVNNGRVYSLKAETPMMASKWVVAISTKVR